MDKPDEQDSHVYCRCIECDAACAEARYYALEDLLYEDETSQYSMLTEEERDEYEAELASIRADYPDEPFTVTGGDDE